MVGTDYYVGLELMLCYVAASADLQVGKDAALRRRRCVVRCGVQIGAVGSSPCALRVTDRDGGWRLARGIIPEISSGVLYRDQLRFSFRFASFVHAPSPFAIG